MNEQEQRIAELLQQNGLGLHRISEEQRLGIRRTVEREEGKLRRMKRVVIGLWMAVGILLPVHLIVMTHPGTQTFLNTAPRPLVIFLLMLYQFASFAPFLAIVSSVLYFFRARRVDQHRTQDRLARVEDLLKQLLEEKKKSE